MVEEKKKKDGNVSKKINHRLTPFVKYNNDKGKEDTEDIHKKKKILGLTTSDKKKEKKKINRQPFKAVPPSNPQRTRG